MEVNETARIFLIEDDPDIRESILELLTNDGYGTDSASSCREAIDKLRRSNPKPCLILLDLRLRGEDGSTFREEQMRDDAISRIPIVVLSADVKLKEKSRRMGAVDSLKKPVDIDDFLNTVRRNCGA